MLCLQHTALSAVSPKMVCSGAQMLAQECEEVLKILGEIYNHEEKGTWVAFLTPVLLLAQCCIFSCKSAL